MTDKDFKNIEDIKRIWKYMEKNKMYIKSWPNTAKMRNSLELLIEENKDYVNHIQLHH